MAMTPKLATVPAEHLPADMRATFAPLAQPELTLEDLDDDTLEQLGEAEVAALHAGGKRRRCEPAGDDAQRLWACRLFVAVCRDEGWRPAIDSRRTVAKFAKRLRARGLKHATVAAYLARLLRTAELQGATDLRWLRCLVSNEQCLARSEIRRKDVLSPLTSRDVWEFGWRQFEAGSEALVEATSRRARRAAATRQRDGALAILAAACPLRRANLAGIHLGLNLDLATGDLTFAAIEMKGRRRFACTLPEPIAEVLRLHVESGRKVLLGQRQETALFLGYHGQALSEQQLRCAVSKRSEEDPHIRSFSPHFVRDALPNLVASEAPEARWLVTELLTHSERTTDKEYGTLIDTSAAVRRAHRIGEALRELGTQLAGDR